MPTIKALPIDKDAIIPAAMLLANMAREHEIKAQNLYREAEAAAYMGLYVTEEDLCKDAYANKQVALFFRECANHNYDRCITVFP